ncbi:MAG: cytidine deaminase [Dehalococcoidales bacterium]
MTKKDLIDQAFGVTGDYQPSDDCTSGSVGAALITKAGNVYTGICIDCASSLGFCAEHSAIAEMLKHKESEIEMIVAVDTSKKILPPCGRCRELIYQVNKTNVNTKVVIAHNKTILLKELLPHRWQEVWE